MAAVKRCVRKTRFVRCPGRLWNRTRGTRTLCGFQHHKGEKLLCFQFSDPIIVGLIVSYVFLTQLNLVIASTIKINEVT